MYQSITALEAEAFEIEASGIFPSFSAFTFLKDFNETDEKVWDIFHKMLFYTREVRRKKEKNNTR